MAEPGETVLDPEKREEPKPEPTPSLTKDDIMAELDKRLAARDQAILQGMQQMLETVVGRQEPKKVVEEPVLPSSQDFFNDPSAAMQKFYEAKVAPLIAERAKPTESDDTAINASIEVEKMKLKERYGPEEYNKYSAFFEQVLQKVDKRVVTQPLGMDAVWRLAKSYGEDAINAEEKKRQERNTKTNLEVGGGGVVPASQKV